VVLPAAHGFGKVFPGIGSASRIFPYPPGSLFSSAARRAMAPVCAAPAFANLAFSTTMKFYGMPDIESRGLKMARERHPNARRILPRPIRRRGIDPDTPITHRHGKKGRGVGSQLCSASVPSTEGRANRGKPASAQYENTSNGDFLIDRHPRYAQRLAFRRRLGSRIQARAPPSANTWPRKSAAKEKRNPRFSPGEQKPRCKKRAVFS